MDDQKYVLLFSAMWKILDEHRMLYRQRLKLAIREAELRCIVCEMLFRARVLQGEPLPFLEHEDNLKAVWELLYSEPDRTRTFLTLALANS